jgi:hypothetical protein
MGKQLSLVGYWLGLLSKCFRPPLVFRVAPTFPTFLHGAALLLTIASWCRTAKS